jgi:hypothetical protein
MKKSQSKTNQPKAAAKSRGRKRIQARTLRLGVSPAVASLEAPSHDALARIEAIPLLFTPDKIDTVTHGVVAHDSWARSGMELRDVTDGHVRRLQFAAGEIQFELVAERRARQWEFIGRIYIGEAVSHDFVLVVGSRRLLSNTGGFFTWSSEKVTRRVRLVSQREVIAFEDIVW